MINQYHLDFLGILEASAPAPDEPDGISFAWWSDDALHDFISKADNVRELSEEALDELVYEVARRVDARIENSRED